MGRVGLSLVSKPVFSNRVYAKIQGVPLSRISLDYLANSLESSRCISSRDFKLGTRQNTKIEHAIRKVLSQSVLSDPRNDHRVVFPSFAPRLFLDLPEKWGCNVSTGTEGKIWERPISTKNASP